MMPQGLSKTHLTVKTFKKWIYSVPKCNLPKKKRKIANMEGRASIIKDLNAG